MTDGPDIKKDGGLADLNTGLGMDFDPGISGDFGSTYDMAPATLADGSVEVPLGRSNTLVSTEIANGDTIELGSTDKPITATGVQSLQSEPDDIAEFGIEQMELDAMIADDVSSTSEYTTVKRGSLLSADDDRFDDIRAQREEDLVEEQRLEEQQERHEHPVFGRRMSGIPRYASVGDPIAEAELVVGAGGSSVRYITEEVDAGGE